MNKWKYWIKSEESNDQKIITDPTIQEPQNQYLNQLIDGAYLKERYANKIFHDNIHKVLKIWNN